MNASHDVMQVVEGAAAKQAMLAIHLSALSLPPSVCIYTSGDQKKLRLLCSPSVGEPSPVSSHGDRAHVRNHSVAVAVAHKMTWTHLS